MEHELKANADRRIASNLFIVVLIMIVKTGSPTGIHGFAPTESVKFRDETDKSRMTVDSSIQCVKRRAQMGIAITDTKRTDVPDGNIRRYECREPSKLARISEMQGACNAVVEQKIP